jgi:hypothetical protein
MNEDHDDIRRSLQDALPPVTIEPRRDLWPAMSRRLEAPPWQFAWYDWVLAGLAGAVLAAFPELALVLLYHL